MAHGNGQSSGPWIKKPKGFPASLYVHKRGWAARIDGKVKVIAGKLPPQEALAVFYRKMAEQTAVPTQQNIPETTQQIIEIKPEMPVSPVPVVPAVPSLTVEQLKDQYLAPRPWSGGAVSSPLAP